MSPRRFKREKTSRKLSLEKLESRRVFSITNFAMYQSVVADSFINGNAAHEAVDGMVSNDSRWASDASGNSWLEVTLSAPYAIGSAHLYFGFDTSAPVGAFSIQHFAGGNWVTVANVTGNTATEVKVQFASTVTGSTQFRFLTSQASVRVKEFVLLPPGDHPLGTGVNLNLASVSAPKVSSIYQNNYGIHATDGWVNDNSRWLADGVVAPTTTPHSMEVRLLSPHLVGSFHLYSGASSGTTFQLAAFTIEYANQTVPDSALNWLPVSGGTVSSGTMTGNSVTGNTSGALSIQLTTPVIATHFRVNFTQAFGRIREFVVLPATNASTGTVGYPINTSVNIAPKPTTVFSTYGDRYYRINSRVNSNSLISSETVTSQVPGSTTGEAIQYQLLYSYALDAYRIVNKDSNKALEVLGASNAAGATVAEGNYSASPHQLWRLVPTDGGFFQIVNVWSGMALDLDVSGTSPVVTQQVRDTDTNPANRQEWQPVFVENNFKKGSAGYLSRFASTTRWGYDWSTVPEPDNGDENFFFTPMQWWAREDGVDSLRDFYGDWHNNATPNFLLGFNEPDHATQANATVERALEAWPQLVNMDLPLVSPAVSGGEVTWLTPFMDQVDQLGYRVDYTGMHWYSSPNVNSLINRIDDLQDFGNGRPVWLTEFSIRDWNNGSGNWSEENNYNFIVEFLWRAETKANLEKYSLFMWTEKPDERPTPPDPWTRSNPASNSLYLDQSLTPFGKAYVAWDGDTTIRNDTPYILHNRAASHRLTNTGSSGLNASTIRVEDASIQFQLRDAGNGTRYIVSGADGRRLRFNGTTLDFASAGTTGTSVEWTISEQEFGWQNIVHPQTGRHLQLNRTNNASNAPTALTFTMVAAASATTTASDWFFVKPYEPVSDIGPVIDTLATANQVNENAPVGTMVGITALALEPDAGQTVTYSLTNNAGGRFAIHPTTGVVTVAGPLDFETATSHSITVRALSSDSTSSIATFFVNVLDVQELGSPTVTVTSTNKVYDNTVYVATASVLGAAAPAGELSFVYYSDALGVTTISAPENVGTYFVQAFTAANAGNNAAQSAITQFQITPFALTGSITVANKVFDGTTAAAILTRSLVGVFSGDTVGYTGGSATFDTAAVGSGKTVTATGLSLTGADAVNYSVNTTATTTANITPSVATIANRRVFYSGATGANLSSAGAANNAIATDKSALLPGGASSFANYTNYSRGLNGVIVDINNLPATTTDSQILASLQFAQWNGIAAGGFSALPAAAVPSAMILAGSGLGGAARVKITFPDNTLQNTWLRVTVVANAETALAANDVFYFGNVIGEFNVGNTSTRLRVNGLDTNAILLNQSPGGNSAAVTNIYDLNRDGRVNGQDTNVLLTNQQAGGIVAPITVPTTPGGLLASELALGAPMAAPSISKTLSDTARPHSLSATEPPPKKLHTIPTRSRSGREVNVNAVAAKKAERLDSELAKRESVDLYFATHFENQN